MLLVALGPLPVEASDSDFSFDASGLALSAGRLYNDGTVVSKAEAFPIDPATPEMGVVGGASLLGGVAPLTLGASGDVMSAYFAARVGPVWYLDDFEDLDVGIWAEAALGLRVLKILALEFQTGFYYGDLGDGTTFDGGELWGVPLTVNAKVTLPIWFFNLYGGAGIGVYYVDTTVKGGGQRFEGDDWGFGGQAFLGLLFELGGIGLGLEGRYFVTEKVSVAGGGEAQLEGAALLAVLQISF